MEWSNEMIFEFLHHFETEPVIWNPYDVNHKKRVRVNDAWQRIMNDLSWECTVEDLKKKKDSLMAYYRIHLNKMKESKKSGEKDPYTTSWFAFSTMDSFLRPVYERNQSHENITIKTETSRHSSNEIESCSFVDSPDYCNQSDNASTQQASSTQNFPILWKTEKSPEELPIETYAAKRPMDDTNQSTSETENLDEIELFGKLMASKIRRISKSMDREILMNDINNLVFQALIQSSNSSQHE